jgi:hypothetical protein
MPDCPLQRESLCPKRTPDDSRVAGQETASSSEGNECFHETGVENLSARLRARSTLAESLLYRSRRDRSY